MSAHIIKRREGFQSLKGQVEGAPQVSFNDYGHLVVRFVQGDCQDELIIFDAVTSANIINFCQDRLKPVCRRDNRSIDQDIPF